jgi:hypothetical protein
VSADANYKCGLKDKGLRDIWFAPGWAYTLEQTRYLTHVNNHIDEKEVSTGFAPSDYCLMFFHLLKINTCDSEHDAVVRAATRNKEGYIHSGTGLALCARHALVRKNGVGDLQKGEK